MLQTYEQAEKKLKALGQEHLLRYYAELSEDGKAQLLSQIGELDEVYLDAFSKKDSLSLIFYVCMCCYPYTGSRVHIFEHDKSTDLRKFQRIDPERHINKS